MHEFYLVVFTLTAQLAVGAFVALGLVQVFAHGAAAGERDRVNGPALMPAGPLLVLGLVVSAMHLGSPLRAANSLLHVGTSWLSAEIALGLCFLVLGGVFAVAEWCKWGRPGIRTALTVVAALSGLGLVWAMSQVYSLRTVPAWATPFTPVNFFLTTLLLGSVAVVASLVTSAHVTPGENAFRDRSILWLSLIAAAAAVATIAVQPAYLAYLTDHPDAAAQVSMDLLTVTYWPALVGSQVMLGAGALLLLFALLQAFAARRRQGTALTWPVLVATGLIVAGELVLRILFYATKTRIGFGGQ